MLIPVREPFSFRHTLRFVLSPPLLLNGRQFDPLLDHLVEDEYCRVADLSGQPILYGVKEERVRGRTALRVRILAGPEGPEVREKLRNLVERQFSTALDLAPFHTLARHDGVLSRLAAHFSGMRIPQSPSIFETLVCAILEQQINLSFAHQVKQALIEACGSHLDFEGRRYYAFPEPAALAIATPAQMRRLQISGPKAQYIIGISRAVLDGSLDLEGLRRLDPADAAARLRTYQGVGPWTAQYVGLRALGHLDSLPAADVGLQKAVQRFYGLRQLPAPRRIEQIARAWAGWRSYATFYLWLTYWEDREWNQRLAGEIRNTRRKVKS